VANYVTDEQLVLKYICGVKHTLKCFKLGVYMCLYRDTVYIQEHTNISVSGTHLVAQSCPCVDSGCLW
jgi:hypothetical protein